MMGWPVSQRNWYKPILLEGWMFRVDGLRCLRICLVVNQAQGRLQLRGSWEFVSGSMLRKNILTANNDIGRSF
jgi:hypothetical protein